MSTEAAVSRGLEPAGSHEHQPVSKLGTPATKSGGYAVFEAKGKLQPWTVDLGELQPLEVEVMPTHNGVCHSDIHMRDNDWGISAFPFVPGHEIVGVVRAVGSQVTGLQPGDRVGVAWVCDSCRNCANCSQGQEQICLKGHKALLIGGKHGGFQTAIRVPADFTYTIPEGLESAEAAPLLCAGITAFAPLKRYMTRPGMRVCVLGIGGVGHLAVQFASVMGGVVTAVDIAPDKKEECLRLGACKFEVYDDSTAERLKEQFDILLNCATVNLAAASLLGMLRNDGILVQIGAPGVDAEITIPLKDLMQGQRKVAGTYIGGRADTRLMLELAAAKGVKPIVELMSITQVNEAMERVASGKARYRVVLDMNAIYDPPLLVA